MFSKALFQYAAATIHSGGIIAYPTEAVYGFGCHPDNIDAVANILALKRRPVDAGLIVISDCVARLAPWIDPTARELRKLSETTATPTTWIVTARADAPAWLTGGRSRIAARITQHRIAASLCTASDTAIVSTSANRRGRRPARTAIQVRCWFGTELDLIIPGVADPLAQPTQIRDAATDEVLRG